MRISCRHFVCFHAIPCNSSARCAGFSAKRSVGSRLRLSATVLFALLFLSVDTPRAGAQTGANSDPNYVALRNITLGNEAVSITNFDLKRDAGTFRLNSGTVCFVPPVNGKVTGAVFAGDGAFLLNPPTETERKSLKYLTREDEFSEKFERLVLRFTDSTEGQPEHDTAQNQKQFGSGAPR